MTWKSCRIRGSSRTTHTRVLKNTRCELDSSLLQPAVQGLHCFTLSPGDSDVAPTDESEQTEEPAAPKGDLTWCHFELTSVTLSKQTTTSCHTQSVELLSSCVKEAVHQGSVFADADLMSRGLF